MNWYVCVCIYIKQFFSVLLYFITFCKLLISFHVKKKKVKNQDLLILEQVHELYAGMKSVLCIFFLTKC